MHVYGWNKIPDHPTGLAVIDSFTTAFKAQDIRN